MLIGAAIVLDDGELAARPDRRRCDASDRRAHLLLRAPRVPDLAAGPERGRGTSPRPPTRRSSGSRWCRRSVARTTYATASHDRAEAVRHETMRQASVEARFLPGLIFLPTLGIAAVLFFGGRDAIAGNLTIGQFTLFITLLLQLVWPLEALGWIINLGQRATAAASRSFAWLDGIESLPEPERPGGASGRSAAGALRGRPLPLPDRKRGAGRDRPPGRAGRDRRGLRRRRAQGRPLCSTCSPASTTRRPDACSSAASTRATSALDELRRAVAIVTQKAVLFSVPLRDNLLAARPDADWGDVLDACEAAGVAEFVDDLPDGYDTLIGERGVNLSGGQRQRVALARALIAGSRVLVLDDPMSAVDTETERHLVEHLRPAVAGRTVLISGQRLSTILVADRAVVLRDGRIVEEGVPEDLIRARRRRSPSSSETRRLRHRAAHRPVAPLALHRGTPRPAVHRARARGGLRRRSGRRLAHRRRRDRQRHPRRRRAAPHARRGRPTSRSASSPGCSGRRRG